MIVDHATLDDVRAVARIHVDAWRSAYAHIVPAEYLAALSVEQREAVWRKTVETGRPELLVARVNGSIVGWIAFDACRDEDAPLSQAEIWAIYVAPDNWSKGIGRQLWHRARTLMRQQGFLSCSLWVFSENEPAMRFYRSVGFVADGLPPKQFELGGKQPHEVRYVCRIEM